MANKVKVTTTLSITATGSTAAISGTETTDQTGANYQESTQVIGTTAELVDVGTDLATLGWLFIKNLSTTTNNDVTIASDEAITSVLAVLKPGQHFSTANLSSTTFYARATGTPAQIVLLAIER